MAASSWDGSIQVQNNTGGTIYYAVSAGTGAITVPTVSGTIGQGLQTITDLPSLDGRRIYFSNEQLVNSLFNAGNPVNPSPTGPDFDKIYSFWEYSADASGFTWDVSDVQESSYPLQTVSAAKDSSIYKGTQTFGVGSYEALHSQMVAQPSFTGGPNGVGKVSDLIWSGNAGIGQYSGARIIGPEFLWLTQKGGQAAVSLLPQSMQDFLEAVPWNGTQLVTPEYKDNGWTTNWDVWQNATNISNGYTAAVAAASSDGPQPQTGSPVDFRGVFTYPQEESYGQVTYGPVPSSIIINDVAEDAAIFGTSSNDKLKGTSADEVISGGYGGDRISGGGASSSLRSNAKSRSDGGHDVFWYVRADSSLAKRGLRDVIADFGSDDKIKLADVDANSLVEGDQAFTWIGDKKFARRHSAGELRIDYRNKCAVLQGDVDGNGKADFEVKLLGVGLFDSSNLLLA